MRHRLGIHWQRAHPDDATDMPHVQRMGYVAAKVFEHMWSDADFCAALLAVLPGDALLLARDHPLSEQKDDVWRDPEGTGVRHAEEWAAKVRGGKVHLPTGRTYFLNANELDATNGDRTAIDIYNAAYADRLRAERLYGGLFNFSTGHPRTVDGTPNTPPDYTVFERSHQAIVRGGHIAVCHIYGSAEQPCVPGHYDRLRSCPWQDVRWVIGECGIDQYVTGGEAAGHVGWLGVLGDPVQYAAWLDALILGTNDPRIVAWLPFTYDFYHPWSSFDVRPAAPAFEAYPWQHGAVQPAPAPHPQPTAPMLVAPVEGGIVSQWYGERPDAYAGFGLRGHNGIDYAVPVGTPVRAVADGTVAMTGVDPAYGVYVRLWHKQLRCHTFYAHLEAVTVGIGEQVTQGQVIARSGNTGNSTGPHLHFEVRVADADGNYERIARMGKGAVDPVSFRLGLERGALLAGGRVWLPLVSGASRELVS